VMKRRTFLQGAIASAATAALGGETTLAAGESRPNILWITCEDMSAQIGCYGDAEATTPNLDALAAQGARYDNAYSICGVCAPSRSCLITGMYPPSIGTHHMRCRNMPPAYVRCFPEYLQEAGYYCTNNVKTDYNFDHPKNAWNESSRKAHWRNREDKSQPFFSVFNFTVTHESQIGTLPEDMRDGPRGLLPEQRHDPADAQLPPYYPDTPVIRQHWAHYYDLITAMDAQTGEILRQLEEDGLADNTIVMWYSDHGVGLPRAKRWLYDSGLHIPMIVRWPGVIEPGSVRDELASFVDFAPTVLSLAGVTPPDHMQGQVLLGDAAAPPRDYIYGMRDRMDERYDHIRAVRDKRYKYIRNYEPYRAYDQHLNYPESYPVMQDMRRVQAAGELNDAQQLYFRQSKPTEELYDTDSDPHELENLAEDPALGEDLQRLRDAMDVWEVEVGDLGAIPEFALSDWLAGDTENRSRSDKFGFVSTGNREHLGKTGSQWLEKLAMDDRRLRISAAKAIGTEKPIDVAGSIVFSLVQDADPIVAYWAMVSMAHAPLKAGKPFWEYFPDATSRANEMLWERLKAALDSGDGARQLGAANVFIEHDRAEVAIPQLRALLAHDNEFVRLHAVQLLERIDVTSGGVREALQSAKNDKNNYVKRVTEHALGL